MNQRCFFPWDKSYICHKQFRQSPPIKAGVQDWQTDSNVELIASRSGGTSRQRNILARCAWWRRTRRHLRLVLSRPHTRNPSCRAITSPAVI